MYTISQEQRAMYNYLWNEVSREAAKEYLNQIDWLVNKKMNERLVDSVKRLAAGEYGPVAQIMTGALLPMEDIIKPLTIGAKLYKTITGQQVDQYDSTVTIGRQYDAIKEGIISTGHNNSIDEGVVNGIVDACSELLMSILNVSVPLQTALSGLTAADDAFNESILRNDDQDKALVDAIAAMVNEVGWERGRLSSKWKSGIGNDMIIGLLKKMCEAIYDNIGNGECKKSDSFSIDENTGIEVEMKELKEFIGDIWNTIVGEFISNILT